MAQPLRKVKGDGSPYFRPPEVESTIDRLLAVPREEALAACCVVNRQDPSYVPTGCLLHLLRRAGRDNNQQHLECLVDLFLKRVARAFPVPERHLAGSGRKGVSSAELEIRDLAVGHLVDMLCLDRQGYDERLDIYEAMFDFALAKLRSSARRSVGRHRNPLQPLSDAPEAVDPSPVAEKALLLHAPPPEEKIEARDYRRKLRAAIHLLPLEDRRLLMLLDRDIPIHSKNPGQMTVARILGCSEKTVRNRHDRIERDLRRLLGQEPGR